MEPTRMEQLHLINGTRYLVHLNTILHRQAHPKRQLMVSRKVFMPLN